MNKGILLVDVCKEDDLPINTSNATVILLTLPPSCYDYCCDEVKKVYSKLCLTIEYAVKQNRKLIIFAPEEDRELEVQISILKHWLSEASLSQDGILFFLSEVSFEYTNINSIYRKMLADVAGKIVAKEIERENRSPKLPECVKGWWENPQTTYEDYLKKLNEEIKSALGQKDFRLESQSIIALFGCGRRGEDYENVAEVFNPDHLEDAEFNREFGEPVSLSKEIIETFKRFKQLIPTFFTPQIQPFEASINLDNYQPEKSPPFDSELWKNQTVSSIEQQIEEILRELQRRMDEAFQSGWIGKMHRLWQTKRYAVRRIAEVNRRLEREFDEELRYILSRQNLHCLDPSRCRTAYQNFFSLLRKSLEVINCIWGLRHFAGFSLPRRIPSLIFKIKNPVRTAKKLLQNIFSFLNLYYSLHYLLKEFRRIMQNLKEEVETFPDLSAYRQHTENIVSELELYPEVVRQTGATEEKEDEWIIREHISTQQLLDSVVEHDLQTILNDIEQQIEGSRAKNPITPSLPFVPLVFHNKEAWKVAEEMVSFLEGKFSLIKDKLIKSLRISPQDLNKNIVFFDTPKLVKAKCIWIKPLIKWKRKLIRTQKRPIQIANDILRFESMDNSKENLDSFFALARRTGFFHEEEGKIGLNTELYEFLPETYRKVYFQTKEGLSAQELEELGQHEKNLILTGLSHRGDSLDIMSVIQEKSWDLNFDKNRKAYGMFCLEGERFRLKDSMVQDLWNVFKAKSREDAEPRRFTEEFLRKRLRKTHDEFRELCNLLLTFVIFKGQDEDEQCKTFFCENTDLLL